MITNISDVAILTPLILGLLGGLGSGYTMLQKFRSEEKKAEIEAKSKREKFLQEATDSLTSRFREEIDRLEGGWSRSREREEQLQRELDVERAMRRELEGTVIQLRIRIAELEPLQGRVRELETKVNAMERNDGDL